MERLRPHIFFVDGLGAVVSTVATAYVLPAWQAWIGLPREALFALAVPAACFATYSLSCWLLGARLAPWLAVILIANLAYCALLSIVVAWYVDVVSPLGLAYFGGELVVVAGIAVIEGRLVRTAER